MTYRPIEWISEEGKWPRVGLVRDDNGTVVTAIRQLKPNGPYETLNYKGKWKRGFVAV